MTTPIPINVKVNPYYEGSKSLDGNLYRLTFRWSITQEKWYLDLHGMNNNIEINGIALLPGKDLFRKHGYKELGELWVVDNSGADDNPNYDDFGSRWTLEYTPLE